MSRTVPERGDDLVVDVAREISAFRGGTRGSRIDRIGSSNGCESFMVPLGTRRLKCYECLTPARARIVCALSRALRSAGVAMPECFGTRGTLVVAEWVRGRPMADVPEGEKIDLMAAYQAGIHGAVLPRALRRHGSMPHLRWLFGRVRRYGGGILAGPLVSRLQDRMLRSRPPAAPRGVLHSDLITTNLVVGRHGVVSVDNEFLYAGYGQEWDILNTVKVSFPDRKPLQDRYLAAYSKHRSLHTLESHREYWEASYHLKMAGKRLREGRVDEGLRHLRSAAGKV